MAEPKTRPTDQSPAAFIDAVADPVRRADGHAIAALMAQVSGEPAVMWGPSIVGFGSAPIQYAGGRQADWHIIGFSPRKAEQVLYGLAGAPDAEALRARLGKHSTGKGCLYIKRLSDVDMDVLRTLIAAAVAQARAKAGKEQG